jgi:dinuclear metal center YbgI/SA1388 family protein
MEQSDLVKRLDVLLRHSDFEDASRNGLQVDGAHQVRKVAFAVDACLASFEAAARCGAQLLVVHHGLFWSKPVLPTGTSYRRLKLLFDAGVGLYASHLPLDAHPRLGNNVELCRVLGLRKVRAFGDYHGKKIGFGGDVPRGTTLGQLVRRLAEPIKVFANGPRLVRSVGCISGGAAQMLDQAERAGFDTYVTGEVSHSSVHEIAERRMNVIFGGHYATETLGLKALERHVRKTFRLETEFLDLPTGT